MALVGSREPRLWTPPLRKLTRRTSKGFEVIDFATKVLQLVLMPWQKWLLVHGLELLPDGTYRWRTVIVLVARQNGKTTLLAVLALWRLLLDDARLVVGTSTNLDYAKEAWQKAVDLAEASEEAAPEFKWPPRFTNGEQTLSMLPRISEDGRKLPAARYKIATANRKGARSLSVDLGIADELREHQSWDAWAALSGTTTARPDPQLWALSNAGDYTSVVLNHYRDGAVAALEAGEDPGDVALFEWSAPEGAALDDRRAWRQANPALGHGITEQTLIGKLKLPPEVFRTEHLCQRVDALDGAVEAGAWQACADPAGSLDGLRDRVTLGVDVAPDGQHVTLVAAAERDGRVHLDVVAAWDTTEAARLALADEITQVRPRRVVWFPSGPAAALAAILRPLDADELKGADVTTACMSFSDLVKARRIVHTSDPLLNRHIAGAGKYHQGDGWRFARRGGVGHVDAVYAAAGATWAALTLPPPKPRPLVVVGRRKAA